MLVIMGACAGLCYNALWYFPVLIVIGGFATLVWDTWLQQRVGKLRAKWRRRRGEENVQREAEESRPAEAVDSGEAVREAPEGLQRRNQASSSKDHVQTLRTESGPGQPMASMTRNDADEIETPVPVADTTTHGIRVRIGISIIVAFSGNSIFPDLQFPY